MVTVDFLAIGLLRDDGPCPFCQYPPHLDREEPLDSIDDMLAYLEHFKDKKQEFVVCLSLDVKRRLISRRVVFIGSLTASIVHPREIFAGALDDRACSVVIAHNHPSGEPTPTKADIALTQQLMAAGQIMGIPIEDHIIIGKYGHFSFKANGLMLEGSSFENQLRQS